MAPLFVLLLILLVIGSPYSVDARMPPGHSPQAFSSAGVELPIMKQRCSNNGTSCVQQPLRVAAWNLQRFGTHKMNKPEVVDIIIKVIKTYDVMVIQEVTDSTLTAVPELLERLNDGAEEDEQYLVEQSPRVGRTSYKEQYAFIYKPSRISFESGYLYEDTSDVFQVEPFVAVFTSNTTGPLDRFAIIPLHAKPSDAVNELDALVDVYDDMKARMLLEDAILVGDFNAGCNYIVQGEYEMIRLYTDQRFHWLISDHADTTTKTTSCPYDRLLVAGATLQEATYYSSANTYFFDEALGIESNWTLVKDVSDHYPVGVMIRGTVPEIVKSVLDLHEPWTSVSVKLTGNYNWQDVSALIEGRPSPDLCSTDYYSSSTPKPIVTKTSNLALTVWKSSSLNEIVTTLVGMEQDHPKLVSPEVVSVLGYKLGHDVLRDMSLYLPQRDIQNAALTLLCLQSDADTKPDCSLSISTHTQIN